jgi:hypothetical protein
MSSLYYLGSKLAPICTILVGSPTSICTALASSVTLKAPDVRGMAVLSGVEGSQELSSLDSAAVTAAASSSMPSYSQSCACCIFASSVITPVGPGILSLR